MENWLLAFRGIDLGRKYQIRDQLGSGKTK
jgi:hypothetical protein